MFLNKTVRLEDALRGMELRPFFVESPYFELDPQTGAIDEVYPGLAAVIMDKLAERAGFQWRNSYSSAWFEPTLQNSNRTWTQLLLWSTEAYDLSMDWWTFSLQRMSMGVTFPAGWYDGTTIMVAKVDRTDDDNKSDSFSFFSWTQPFDLYVWIMIVITLFFSGFVYWLLENINPNSDKQRLETNVMENVWLSAINFTQHFEFTPRTNAARLFTVSLSFWSLLMAAAYTANLASFLVVRNVPSIQITSVADAVRRDSPICTYRSAQSELDLLREYPNAKAVRKPTEEAVLKGLLNNECDVALTTVSSWETWQRNADVNNDCNIAWIGLPFKSHPAGIATYADSGKLCTSLITDVLNLHMHRLREDGFIEEAWAQYSERSATVNCDARSSAESENDSGNEQLSLVNMGGIFFFHGVLSVVAIIIALIWRCKGWDRIPKFAKEGIYSRKAIRKQLQELKKRNGVMKGPMTAVHRALMSSASKKTIGERVFDRRKDGMKRSSGSRHLVIHRDQPTEMSESHEPKTVNTLVKGVSSYRRQSSSGNGQHGIGHGNDRPSLTAEFDLDLSPEGYRNTPSSQQKSRTGINVESQLIAEMLENELHGPSGVAAARRLSQVGIVEDDRSDGLNDLHLDIESESLHDEDRSELDRLTSQQLELFTQQKSHSIAIERISHQLSEIMELLKETQSPR